MRALVAALLLTSCAGPEPVPDVFSPAAHQGASEPYRRNDALLWSFRHEPPDAGEVMRYFVPADDQGYTPGEQSEGPDPTKQSPEEAPWTPYAP